MIIQRAWAMPHHETFSIKPIAQLLQRYLNDGDVIVDPFARNATLGTITNDLNPDTAAQYHMEAVEFLDMLIAQGVLADVILFDPPYSPRQVAECYNQIGKKVTMETTQSSFYSQLKDRIQLLTKQGGVVISCGWNSNGIGKTRGFRMTEILLVAHGGAHHDTIVTVEEAEQ